MVVVEDAAARTIRVRLVPAGGNPLQHMIGNWRFEQGGLWAGGQAGGRAGGASSAHSCGGL